jgi:putative transposase
MDGGLARRKNIRLTGDAYLGPGAFFLTLATFRARALFSRPEVVLPCIERLQQAARRTGFDVVAYCFMPDHVHLLVRTSKSENVTNFVRLFKQLTGYAYRRSYGDALWQRSYYDHVLRREEDLRAVAEYIWNNPVRRSLVANRDEYPYSGSLVQQCEVLREG